MLIDWIMVGFVALASGLELYYDFRNLKRHSHDE